MLDAAVAYKHILPLPVGILTNLCDGLQRTVLEHAGFIGDGLGAAGDRTVVQMEGGKISRLSEIVLLKLIEVFNPIGVDRISLAFLNHITGKVLILGGIFTQRL